MCAIPPPRDPLTTLFEFVLCIKLTCLFYCLKLTVSNCLVTHARNIVFRYSNFLFVIIILILNPLVFSFSLFLPPRYFLLFFFSLLFISVSLFSFSYLISPLEVLYTSNQFLFLHLFSYDCRVFSHFIVFSLSFLFSCY